MSEVPAEWIDDEATARVAEHFEATNAYARCVVDSNCYRFCNKVLSRFRNIKLTAVVGIEVPSLCVCVVRCWRPHGALPRDPQGEMGRCGGPNIRRRHRRKSREQGSFVFPSSNVPPLPPNFRNHGIVFLFLYSVV